MSRYYVGDKNVPWWVELLQESGLIIELMEVTPVTYILTFKDTYAGTRKEYLYDGDFLQFDDATWSVTIGKGDFHRAVQDTFDKYTPEKQHEIREKMLSQQRYKIGRRRHE